MSLKYIWKNKEANFGKPLKYQIKGGAHFTFEIILKWNGKYIALRNVLLYFCHNLT